MDKVNILVQAINEKNPISFDYNKKGIITENRIGNPYAVFILTAKNTRIQSIKVHIVQTDGPTDSTILNTFRMFNLDDLENINILDDNIHFCPDHKDYKPESDMYKDIIAKV